MLMLSKGNHYVLCLTAATGTQRLLMEVFKVCKAIDMAFLLILKRVGKRVGSLLVKRNKKKRSIQNKMRGKNFRNGW